MTPLSCLEMMPRWVIHYTLNRDSSTASHAASSVSRIAAVDLAHGRDAFERRDYVSVVRASDSPRASGNFASTVANAIAMLCSDEVSLELTRR